MSSAARDRSAESYWSQKLPLRLFLPARHCGMIAMPMTKQKIALFIFLFSKEATKSDHAQEPENQDNHQNGAQATARIIAPLCAIWPRRQRTDEKQNQNDKN